MKKILLVCILLIASWYSNAQVIYTPTDEAVWKKVVTNLQQQKEQSLSTLIVKVGKEWMGTPYVAHTLERPDGEKLVINLRELDCTTFLENTLAVASTLKSDTIDFNKYAHKLQQLRYRDGLIQGYSSRLHYFTEWLTQNEKKGNLQIITGKLGGQPYEKPINFMSAHRTAYPALKDENAFQDIKKIEEIINTHSFSYIPKTSVNKIEDKLKYGDIIAITTSIGGLDVVHVGFAITQNNRIHLLHASLDEKKVVISHKPLAEYLLGNKNQSGIMVARVVE